MASSVLFYRGGPFSVGAIRFDLLLEEHHELKSTLTKHPVESGSTVSDHIVKELRSGTLKGLVSNFSLKTATDLPDNISAMIGPSMRRYAALGASVVGSQLVGALPGSQNAIIRRGASLASGVATTAVSALTQYPTADDVKAAIAALGAPPNRARDAWTLFKRLWEARTPVDIVTGLEKYKQFVVTSVSTSRTGETGECLEFDVTFEEFRKVTSKKTRVDAAIAPKLVTDAGKQASPKKHAGRTTGTGKSTTASKAATTTKVRK